MPGKVERVNFPTIRRCDHLHRAALLAPGRGPARRVICVYVDGQAHDPVKRAPALVASWCAITRARNLLARRNVSLGRRLIAASPPKRAAVKKMSAAR